MQNTAYNPVPGRGKAEWRSINIRPWNIFLLLFVEIDIVIIISTLLGVSLTHSGFVTLGDQTGTFDIAGVHFSSLWSVGLLWTAFPALLMTLFRFYWDSIVNAFADETPFAELRKPGGCSAKASILLDYRVHPSIYSWLIAFKNRHILLGSSMLLSFLVSIVLVPLSARLFAPSDVQRSKQVPMAIKTDFNASYLNASINYQPIFDSVSAARLHGGLPSSWTDGEFAFPTFELENNESGSSNATSLSLKITAYSAYLDCKEITHYSTNQTPSDEKGYISLLFNAEDRGCPITIKEGIGPGADIYLKTAFTQQCEAAAGYSRISFSAGNYSPSSPNKLKDLVIISCMPTYRNTSGVLKALSGPRSVLSLASFTPDRKTSQLDRPYTWRDFEKNMLQVSTQNPKAPVFSSSFGDLFLSYSDKTNLSTPLSPESLMSAASTIFTTTYAITAASQLFQPAAPPEIATGTLSMTINRLHVVPWAAYVSIVILIILIIQTLLIFAYLQRHRSILREEPAGIMGAANLLYGSNVNYYVEAAHTDPLFDGSLLKYMERKYFLSNARCGMDWTREGHGRIVITRMDAKHVVGQEMRPLVGH
jgi:hypothetical protein